MLIEQCVDSQCTFLIGWGLKGENLIQIIYPPFGVLFELWGKYCILQSTSPSTNEVHHVEDHYFERLHQDFCEC